jgi:hypothetical protein
MSTDLEQLLRDHYASVVDELDLAPLEYGDVYVRSAWSPMETVGGTRSGMQSGRNWMMAAAVLVLIAGGVLVLGARRVAAPPVSTPLSDVTTLQPDEWVVATALPDGQEWLYGLDSIEADSTRTSAYGTLQPGNSIERLTIHVGRVQPATLLADTVEISGTTWMVDDTEGWHAVRDLGDVGVEVYGSGPFDDTSRDILAKLVVAAEADLPSPPLGRETDTVEVASYELDGVVHTLRVQESNGFWCHWTGTSAGTSGGCGDDTDPAAILTIDGGSFAIADGATTGDVERAGSVSPQVARVEVQFTDGTVVSVFPEDLSGQFDRKFWIVAATVSQEFVANGEVRAYDQADQLLATEPLTPNGG